MRQEYLHGYNFLLGFCLNHCIPFSRPDQRLGLLGYRAVCLEYICVQLKYHLTLKETRIKLSSIAGWRPSRGWEWIHNKQPIEMLVCLFIDEEKRCVKMVAFCSRGPRSCSLGRSKPAMTHFSLLMFITQTTWWPAETAFQTDLVKRFIWLVLSYKLSL